MTESPVSPQCIDSYNGVGVKGGGQGAIVIYPGELGIKGLVGISDFKDEVHSALGIEQHAPGKALRIAGSRRFCRSPCQYDSIDPSLLTVLDRSR